jgi:hypothetical protein
MQERQMQWKHEQCLPFTLLRFGHLHLRSCVSGGVFAAWLKGTGYLNPSPGAFHFSTW